MTPWHQATAMKQPQQVVWMVSLHIRRQEDHHQDTIVVAELAQMPARLTHMALMGIRLCRFIAAVDQTTVTVLRISIHH